MIATLFRRRTRSKLVMMLGTDAWCDGEIRVRPLQARQQYASSGLWQMNTSGRGRNPITGAAVDRMLPLLSPLSRRRSRRKSGAETLRLASPSARAVLRPESASIANQTVALTVNGRPHVLDLDPRATLLDALREHSG
jgi:hypothetical protein